VNILTLTCVYRTPSPELNPEERDARTVFCMQLAARIRPRDLEEFFSAVGKVRLINRYIDGKHTWHIVLKSQSMLASVCESND